MSNYTLTVTLLFILITQPIKLLANNNLLTLPTYYLEIDSTNLNNLYENPNSGIYYSSSISIDNITYDCEVRFRGSTGQPKKSWQIKFDDDNNIFSAEKINLNSEFEDSSMMRNYLAMKLFSYFEYPASNVNYINLLLNNEYKGVFLRIEQIDEYFLQRNSLIPYNLYKAENHGANMAPLTHYNQYQITWTKKIGDPLDFTDIQMFFSKIYYWTNDDFEINITNEINIENIINYFAIEFSISSHDCFTKNLYLYHNPSIEKFEIFPWDNDATFGNDWTGAYNPSYEQWYPENAPGYSEYVHTIKQQILFQRLMEYEIWNNSFWNKISEIIQNGFIYLHNEIDTTYANIVNDVEQDTFKICSNIEFYNNKEKLHNFLIERESFLNGFYGFDRIQLSNLYCSNPFPSQEHPEVIFQVTSQHPQTIQLKYIHDLLLGIWGDGYEIESLELFDDGNHNDELPNDLIYGNMLTVSENNSGIIPFTIFGSTYTYPPNGFFYINMNPTYTYALNYGQTQEEFLLLEFENIYEINNDYIIELHNPTQTDLNISYCSIQIGNYYNTFLIPENSVIQSDGTIYLTSNLSISGNIFGYDSSIGNLFYNIAIGDTIRLLSPSLSVLSTKYFINSSIIEIDTNKIIINEINYHSSDNYDPEDWIELYNPNQYSLDLSDWLLKDDDDNHIFILPSNTFIEENGYLVICRNLNKFINLFSNTTNAIGDVDFEFSGSGDMVRLFDQFGITIDSVHYDDNDPWPSEPDGNGPTLELIDPQWENALPQSWASSTTNYGTPGDINSTYLDVYEEISFQPSIFSLDQNYPNPFNSSTTINYQLDKKSDVEINIYNFLGKYIKTLEKGYFHNGYYTIKWNAIGLPSGIYFYVLYSEKKIIDVKKAILIK